MNNYQAFKQASEILSLITNADDKSLKATLTRQAWSLTEIELLRNFIDQCIDEGVHLIN